MLSVPVIHCGPASVREVDCRFRTAQRCGLCGGALAIPGVFLQHLCCPVVVDLERRR
jgi:hypothetical protein